MIDCAAHQLSRPRADLSYLRLKKAQVRQQRRKYDNNRLSAVLPILASLVTASQTLNLPSGDFGDRYADFSFATPYRGLYSAR